MNIRDVFTRGPAKGELRITVQRAILTTVVGLEHGRSSVRAAMTSSGVGISSQGIEESARHEDKSNPHNSGVSSGEVAMALQSRPSQPIAQRDSQISELEDSVQKQFSQ